MPKNWDRRLFVGGMFFFAFWLYVALPFLYTVPRYSGHDETPNKCSAEGFWEKTSCDPTAYFTLWLVAFTGILAVSTIGLWFSTRKLWVAAKASEVALKTLERPYVVIDPRTNHTDVLAHFEVHIVNHGRSVAFAGVVQGDFFIRHDPPQQFAPLKTHEQGVHWVLPGYGKGRVLKWTIRGKTAEEIERVRAGTDKMYFLAVISYRDAAKNWYDTGICVVYNPETKETYAAGGPEHNFMT